MEQQGPDRACRLRSSHPQQRNTRVLAPNSLQKATRRQQIDSDMGDTIPFKLWLAGHRSSGSVKRKVVVVSVSPRAEIIARFKSGLTRGPWVPFADQRRSLIS